MTWRLRPLRPAGPSVSTVMLAASLVIGWRLATVEEMPAWQVSVKAAPRGSPPVFRAERNGWPDRGLRGPSGEGRLAVEEHSWRVFLPEPMAVLRSDWRLRLEFWPSASAAPAAGIAIRVNGAPVADGIRADKPVRLTLAASRLRPDHNTIEVRCPAPDTLRLLRVRNYAGLNTWFPTLCLIGRPGPYWRGVDRGGLVALGATLAAAVLVFGGLARWLAARHGAALWTAGQWRRAAHLTTAAVLAVSAWNLAAPIKVVFAQWSAVVLIVGGFGLWAFVCAWRNAVTARWATLTEAQRHQWTQRRRALVAFACTWLAYNSNFARVGMPDCQPPPRMAISFIRHGDFDLDEAVDLHGEHFPVRRTEAGHYVSRWTPGSALFCIPFFLIPTWLGVEAPSATVDILAKVTASTVTALSAGFLYLSLSRVCSARGAGWLTAAYALGTANFPISSQDTWQHGPAELSLAIVLYLILRGRRDRREWLLTGLFLGLAPVCRPPAAWFAAALALWAGRQYGWRVWLWYALGALAPLAFLVGYNIHYFGTPGLAGYEGIRGGGWTPHRTPEGFVGLLISPNRGMFVYSPFLVMLIYGWIRAMRHPERPWRELGYLGAGAILAYVVMTAAWRSWHGIFTYGCRYSADAMPLWTFLGAFGIDRLLQHAGWRRLFMALVIVSILFQALGVYVNYLEWNWAAERRMPVQDYESTQMAWDIRYPQLLFQIRYVLGLEKGTLHPEW